MGFLVLPASADATTDAIQAANNVYVSNYTIDPAVLFTGDTATATFYVTNGNANQSVMVNHATFGDNDILLTSGTYDTNVNIGPLQTRSFVFSIGTDKICGHLLSILLFELQSRATACITGLRSRWTIRPLS